MSVLEKRSARNFRKTPFVAPICPLARDVSLPNLDTCATTSARSRDWARVTLAVRGVDLLADDLALPPLERRHCDSTPLRRRPDQGPQDSERRGPPGGGAEPSGSEVSLMPASLDDANPVLGRCAT